MKRYVLLTIAVFMVTGMAADAAGPLPLGYWTMAAKTDTGFVDESGAYALVF